MMRARLPKRRFDYTPFRLELPKQEFRQRFREQVGLSPDLAVRRKPVYRFLLILVLLLGIFYWIFPHALQRIFSPAMEIGLEDEVQVETQNKPGELP